MPLPQPDDRQNSTNNNVSVGNSPDASTTATNVNPNPNKLHNYVNWSYKLTLHMIKIDSYNSLQGGNTPDLKDSLILIKTGGVGTATGIGEDVYIEDLRFISFIGNRLQSSATNNFDIVMTVKEPYGASFIGTITANAIFLGYQGTALADIAYVLEIDFAGYDESGKLVPSILDSGKKFIPLKMINLDMKLESAGSSYTITFVPYSFYTFTPHYSSVQHTTKITGDTVKTALDELMNILNENEKKSVDTDKIKKIKDSYEYEVVSFSSTGTSNTDMLESKFAYDWKGKEGNMPWRDENGKFIMTLNGGSIVKDAIKNIVLSSKYFTDRYSSSGNNSNPAELIKVIPEMQIGEFDSQRNEYSKKIKYKIFNTLLYGEVHPGAGAAPVTDKNISKIYNYIFTGKNDDILNLDLNWNLLYYTIRTPSVDAKSKMFAQTPSVAARAQSLAEVVTATRAKIAEIPQAFPNMPYRSIAATEVAEFFDAKMTNSYGDNITIDLEIIGDPDWIPQDSSIRGGSPTIGANNYVNGSVAIDVSGVYIKILLKTPRDYDDKTGLMQIQSNETFVEGKYLVVSIENIFERGKFKQKLNLVKVPNQSENRPDQIKDKDPPFG